MSKKSRVLGSADAIEQAFYAAIARADIAALMALWADDDDIVCIHPGAPRLVGHAAIRASWETIFERGGVQIRPVQLHVSLNLMVSIHNLVEEIDNDLREPQDMHVLATNVYIKTAQGWRIVTHHASIAPGNIPVDSTAGLMLH